MEEKMPFEIRDIFPDEEDLIDFLNELIVAGSWANLVLSERHSYHPNLYRIMVESIHEFCARYREELKEMAVDDRISRE